MRCQDLYCANLVRIQFEATWVDKAARLIREELCEAGSFWRWRPR
jgi:hypothetical protein